jgi:holo-[acyl-carrier protein] synthase
MILGVGNDIVEVARIKAILSRHPQRFLDRVFTPHEQDYCLKRKDPALHLAARFAAKEAIVKALGTGFSQGLSWLDIEIRNDAKGKPVASFSPFAKELFGDLLLHISMSHCHQYATAVAIWARD